MKLRTLIAGAAIAAVATVPALGVTVQNDAAQFDFTPDAVIGSVLVPVNGNAGCWVYENAGPNDFLPFHTLYTAYFNSNAAESCVYHPFLGQSGGIGMTLFWHDAAGVFHTPAVFSASYQVSVG